MITRKHSLSLLTLSVLASTPTLAQTLNEEYILGSPTNTLSSPNFGNCVAINNGIIAVGSEIDEDDNNEIGSVYLYDASIGALLHELQSTDSTVLDEFGTAVDIDNNTVVVGASADADSGAVYLFDATTGVQTAKLVPSDLAALDHFGISVAIDNNIIAVGSIWNDENGPNAGAVYLFDATTGAQLFKVFPDTPATFLEFGRKIALSDGILAVGSPKSNVQGAGIESGAVYLFDTTTGAQLDILTPDDIDNYDQFGTSIAIGEGMVIAGAIGDDDRGESSGSAYIFDLNTGNQLHKLVDTIGGDSYDYFGSSVAISDGIVCVGARENRVNVNNEGSVFLFNASSGAELFNLYASDGFYNNRLGSSVSMDNGIIVAGTKAFGINSFQGSAYVFFMPDPCLADFNADFRLNFIDLSIFLDAYSAGEEIGDFNDDGDFNFLDLSLYLESFQLGCP